MASEIYNAIDAISREKGIDPKIIVSAVEDAIVVATRKLHKTQETLRAEMDKDTGQIRAFESRTWSKRQSRLKIPSTRSRSKTRSRSTAARRLAVRSISRSRRMALGRISAQTAKQVIFQKVREAERETVYQEYSGRVASSSTPREAHRRSGPHFRSRQDRSAPAKKGTVAAGVFSVGDASVRDQARREASKGPQWWFRARLRSWFSACSRQEVPEIYDGTVIDRGCAREAGERTKIAVIAATATWTASAPASA